MAENDGFLGRWSRRKLDVREGRPVEESVQRSAPPLEVGSGGGTAAAPVLGARAPSLAAGGAGGRPTAPEPAELEPPASAPAQSAQPAAQPPPPTLDDTLALTPQSDFKPFMARGVAPEVKNAALKKLFADPHFNVMDRLDIYIDDYGKPDPLPAAMLRQMASAKFLKLFDEEEEKAAEPTPGATGPDAMARDDADSPALPDVAQSDHCHDLPSQLEAPALPASHPDDADPDLRLQPHHAAGPEEPGPRTG